MNRQQVINQTKAIILKHVKPSRVWLYGSEAMEVATPTSDIDIAYWRDKDDSSQVLLANIINELPTYKR